MSGRETDVAIVGGGLAGGLIALALHRALPELSIVLCEAGDSFGGNHRWSWFEGDLDSQCAELLAPFRKKEWQGGNRVCFPEHSRLLSADYRSLDSRDFDAGLRKLLPQSAILTNTRVSSLEAGGIILDDGERISADTVIDCRDAVPSEHLTGGWQVFLGQHLRTAQPHGIEQPVIMDATVEQIGGYRFVYLLPLGPDEIFIEDTYYADSPALDAPILRERIAAYATEKGWSGEVLHEETGILPVITGGDIAAYRNSLAQPGVALAGARGGFVHPLTSYTIPIAAENAIAIAYLFSTAGRFKDASAPFDGTAVAAWIDARAKRHWRRTGFYRMLGKMLFGAAKPEERYHIFQRFYRLPEPLIERFYASRSTLFDRARVLTGKPPVPIPVALRSLFAQQPPLITESTA